MGPGREVNYWPRVSPARGNYQRTIPEPPTPQWYPGDAKWDDGAAERAGWLYGGNEETRKRKGERGMGWKRKRSERKLSEEN